ncbi:unnamed protein product [Linum tenue]|uniref:NTF2 domain-containing protein n=1 Tax=Linum tenue TaxID=586396 RepID=A0AAV0H7J8_9ROSI|nr:unnamed protein product [Linum tenue]
MCREQKVAVRIGGDSSKSAKCKARCRYVRVVKETDLKSVGLSPRREKAQRERREECEKFLPRIRHPELSAMDPDAVAKAFVDHYYSMFDSNRAGLASLYEDGSMLTFEGQKIQGSQNIVAKLTSLPFQQCQHSITTVDCQPSGPAGGMLVFVSGNLQLAGEQHALKFSQVADILIVFSLEDKAVLKELLVCCHYTSVALSSDFSREKFNVVSMIVGKLIDPTLETLYVSFPVLTAYNLASAYGVIMVFTQMFHLMPTPTGSFYVFNDIFRLNYA